MARSEFVSDRVINRTETFNIVSRLPADTQGLNVYLQDGMPLPLSNGRIEISVEYSTDGVNWVSLGLVTMTSDDIPQDRNGITNPRLLIGVEVPATDTRLRQSFARCVITPFGNPKRIALDIEPYKDSPLRGII